MLDNILIQEGAEEVEAMSVYRDIFRLGEGYIQRSGTDKRDMKGNPVAYWKNQKDERGHFRILFDDTFEETLEELQKADFAILNGVSYFGRKNIQANASKMYALLFDIDGQTDVTLQFLIRYASIWGRYPVPNYIILSGHGVHVYYVFDDPISLYPQTKVQLKQLKYGLTTKLWNVDTSTIDKPQYQGINQGFRPIGGHTKIDGVAVRAFRLNRKRVTLEQLNECVPDEYKMDLGAIWKESRYTLEDAKKLFPEWYEKRIVQGDTTKGRWTCKPDLYEWWKRQIKAGASYHHRYFAIMCLAIYGVKSGIDLEKARADSLELMPLLNGLQPGDPFTLSDVESALECYDERYVTFPRDDISKLSAIEIKANKRNFRKQKVHLKIARNTLEILNEDARKALQGRPSKADQVKQWRSDHPAGTKAECARATGLSRPTIYKWWDL